MNNSYAGGDVQQQMAIDIPQQTIEAGSNKGFYKHLREIREMPFKEKVEATLQMNSIVWGYTSLILFAVIVGAIFHTQIIDFVVKRYFKK